MADNGAVSTGEPQTGTPITGDSNVVTKDDTQTGVPVTRDSKLVTKDETHTAAATKDSDVKCQPVRSH